MNFGIYRKALYLIAAGGGAATAAAAALAHCVRLRLGDDHGAGIAGRAFSRFVQLHPMLQAKLTRHGEGGVERARDGAAGPAPRGAVRKGGGTTLKTHTYTFIRNTIAVVLAVCRGARPTPAHARRAFYSCCKSKAEELAAEEAAALESERESALGLRVKARPCCFFFSFSQSPLAFLPRL